jgi:hypothetical protein
VICVPVGSIPTTGSLPLVGTISLLVAGFGRSGGLRGEVAAMEFAVK